MARTRHHHSAHHPAEAMGPALGVGRPGRLEVWYATFTEADGTGWWLHHEAVAAPGSPSRHGLGWLAWFPSDGPAGIERFGPDPVPDPAGNGPWFETAAASVGSGHLRGAAGGARWDLRFEDTSPPIYTFGRAAWERRFLPAAQAVPWPTAQVTGTVTVDGATRSITATGAVARIFGHGNAERWGWLHLPLDGDGTGGGEGTGDAPKGAIEIVTAVPRRRSLRWLPPIALVQVRLPGRPDWPANPLLGAVRLRTRFDEWGWQVSGRIGARRLTVSVSLPPDRSVAVDYADPDGAPATCFNSEVASASVTIDGGSAPSRSWTVDGRAHAELGRRP